MIIKILSAVGLIVAALVVLTFAVYLDCSKYSCISCLRYIPNCESIPVISSFFKPPLNPVIPYGPTISPDSVMVKFRPNVNLEAFSKRYNLPDGAIGKEIYGYRVVKLPEDENLDIFVIKIRLDQDVEEADLIPLSRAQVIR